MRTLDDIASFLTADFARLVAEHGVPGAAIAVLKDGEVIDDATGVLSTATKVEATPDSSLMLLSNMDARAVREIRRAISIWRYQRWQERGFPADGLP